jgi:hypothetical protein
MTRHNSSRSFRPTVECLESRQLLSGATYLRLGNYDPPGYSFSAGEDRIEFFAVRFFGSLSHANATAAWRWGYEQGMSSWGTLDHPENVSLRTTGKSHPQLLIGWYDEDTQDGGWLAGHTAGSYGELVTVGPWWNQSTEIQWHNHLSYLSNWQAQAQYQDDGWVTYTWTTDSGYRVSLQMANDGANAVAGFSSPS